MRKLRAPWRLLRLCLHLLHGIAVMALRFSALDAAGRAERIQWWSAKLLRLAGIALHASGSAPQGAALLVANHVSWLDIAAIHAVAPRARFVSKAEVLAWPLLGWLIRGAGTLFIERERKRDALRVLHHVADALRAGDLVAVFPEGTTGDGEHLLPFHANLLQAAIAANASLACAALRYGDGDHRFSPAALFLGETTLLQSAWRVLSAEALTVHVVLFTPPSQPGADRRALAQSLHAAIEARLQGSPPPAAPLRRQPPDETAPHRRTAAGDLR